VGEAPDEVVGVSGMNISSVEERRVSRSGQTRLRAGGAVLVIGNDLDAAEEIRRHLQACGHPVCLLRTTDDALWAARSDWSSVLIIDRAPNGEDGLSIVETLRREGNPTPVLLVGPPSSVDDRISGFKAGVDQYLVKPFDARELEARVEALLRRAGEPRATRLQVGDLRMDLVERTVRAAGRSVDLLPMEFRLLEYLMRRPGQALSRAQLLEDVWRSKFAARTNVVDVQIGNLRHKLDPTGERRYILSVRSVGFMLTDAGMTAAPTLLRNAGAGREAAPRSAA
jgi:two-component system, OmpR family, response regulator